MAVRSEQAINAEMEKVRDKVNEGDRAAEVIWDTLQWVLSQEGVESPSKTHVDEE